MAFIGRVEITWPTKPKILINWPFIEKKENLPTLGPDGNQDVNRGTLYIVLIFFFFYNSQVVTV